MTHETAPLDAAAAKHAPFAVKPLRRPDVARRDREDRRDAGAARAALAGPGGVTLDELAGELAEGGADGA